MFHRILYGRHVNPVNPVNEAGKKGVWVVVARTESAHQDRGKEIFNFAIFRFE